MVHRKLVDHRTKAQDARRLRDGREVDARARDAGEGCVLMLNEEVVRVAELLGDLRLFDMVGEGVDRLAVGELVLGKAVEGAKIQLHLSLLPRGHLLRNILENRYGEEA